MTTREVGQLVERSVVKYLQDNGFDILDMNWTCRWGEIDIVAKEGETLVFVEVKYRSSDKFGFPTDSVTYRKKKALLRAIRYYLLNNKTNVEGWRFDVVSVLGNKLSHYKSVSID